MTSKKPNESPESAVPMDPVHPVAPPPAGTDARTEQSVRGPEGAGYRADSLLAADHGWPAALDHEIVALSTPGGSTPLVLHTEEADIGLNPRAVQVWARAGRMTVVAEDGEEMKFVMLSPDEHEELELGERWPAHEPESAGLRFAAAAARDIADIVTFPVWLARTTKSSGERNAAMHSLVRRLRKCSPETDVFVCQTYPFEHHHPDRHHPYDHRGIVGHEGYPREL